MSPDDKILFERWRSRRDAEAFRTLADRYAPMVYSAGRRITGNPQDAEDVVQATFETLASQRRPPRPHLGAWLHRVATYRALNLLRSERRRRQHEEAYHRDRPNHTDVTWDDIYDLVDKAIAALPTIQRDAIVASYLEGHTHEQIAQQLGISRSAVTQRVQKGIAGIRRALRRKGVRVPIAVLGGLLSRAASGATPPGVVAKLGKLSLSGYAGEAACAHGAWQFLGSGLASAKVLGLAAALVGIAVTVYFVTTNVGQEAGAPSGTNNGTPSNPVSGNGRSDFSIGKIIDGMLASFLNGGDGAHAELFPGIPPVLTGTVVDPQGQPVPSVGVHGVVTTARGERHSLGAGSDSDGRFEIRWSTKQRQLGIHGKIRLAARPPGRLLSNEEFPPGPEVQFALAKNEMREDIQLVLDPSAYGSISGRVVDSQGHPISGAQVSARSKAPKHSNVPLATDAEGRFTIPFLHPAGVYRLSASAPGRTPATREGVLPHSEDIEIVLQGRGAIEGQVINAQTGIPVTEFACYYGRSRGIVAGAGVVVTSPQSSTKPYDEQGHFRLEDVDAGVRSLEFEAEGYRHERVTVGPVEEDETVTGLIVALEPVFRITGHVLNSEGRPVKDAAIYTGSQVEHPFPGFDGSSRGVTDEDGRFSARGLEIDSPYVAASHPDYCTTVVRASLDSPSPVSIVLTHGASVEGRVTLGGEPAANYRVTVWESETWTNRVADVDRDGRYNINGINPGPVTVAVSPGTTQWGEYRPYGIKPILAEAAIDTVTVVDIELPDPVCSLEGQTVRHGAAVPGMVVRATVVNGIASQTFQTSTNAFGEYRFDPLPAGHVRVSAEVDGQVVRRETLELAAGAEARQDLVLDGGATVECMLVDAPEAPHGILVALLPDGYDAMTLTDAMELAVATRLGSAEGSIAFEDIPPGNYTIATYIPESYPAHAYRDLLTSVNAASTVRISVSEGLDADVRLSF